MADDQATKRTYPVRLLGRNLAIQTTAPRDEVDAVATFVAGRLEEVRVASRSTDLAEVAMLVALNLASDLLRTQATLADERSRLNRWAADLCTRLDARSHSGHLDATKPADVFTDPLE